MLDFVVAQVLGDDTALGSLPDVLARLVTMPGIGAAVAFRPSGDQTAGVLGMHPPGAVEPGLLARIGALTLTQRDRGTAAPVHVTLEAGDPGTSALLAYSAPVDGQCLCALALIGDATSWDEEIRSTAHAVAAIVATQIRHANDLAKLAERQALTRELIAASPTAIIAMDDGGRLIEFNPAAEELSGYRHDDVLGRPMSEVLLPERDRARFLEHIATYAATGDPEEFTGQIVVPRLRADGTERTVELTPVQLTIGGEIIFAGFLRDLTELDRSHAALADQTERLNRLIEAAIPGILISDERGLITHINRSFGAIFDLAEPEQLVGTRASQIVNRVGSLLTDPGDFHRRSAEVLATRQPMSEVQFKMTDGRTTAHDYWPVLVDGRFRGDLWLAWDVTDRAALEVQRQKMLEAERRHAEMAELAQRQLSEKNARLRKLDEARNQFLAIVSHELRTPLTSIISFSELIKGEAEGLTPEGLKFLGIIERNAERMHRLVGDLLMLDRLDAGALPLDLAPVSIPELVAEAARSASATAAKQGVTVEFIAEYGPDMSGDQRRLMQVLDNLIANAVKFSHRGTRVHVSAGYDDGQWRIDVTDEGIGIPPDEAGLLFTRFVRASNARTAGLPGTGLGLSIVKILVEMHGGHVEVASTLGQGSTFSVYLPAEAR